MVDTSVWIDYFHQRQTQPVQQLAELLEETDRVLLGDLVMTEILQGIKFKRETKQIEPRLRPLIVKGLVGEQIARSSAEYFRQLRGQGKTVRSTIDCLIATWCIENDVPLLYTDKDFKHFIQFGLAKA